MPYIKNKYSDRFHNKNRYSLKKYERIIIDIERLIAQRVLKPGEQMPSIREISSRKKVSINTVINAYEKLEQRGLIISRPQSGFFVLNQLEQDLIKSEKNVVSIPVDIKIPELVSVLFDSAQLKNITSLGAACLSPEFYPTQAISSLVRQNLRERPQLVGSYQLPPGDFEYRRQISKYYAKIGFNINPEEIIATNGAMEAINLALRAICEAGDTIVIESPLYFGLLQSIESLRLKVIEIPSDSNNGIDLDVLKTVLKKYKVVAAVVMPNFNNPLGTLLSDERKIELTSICARYNIPIIEDDIYGDISFSGVRPKPLKAFDGTNSVITCSSFSKTLTPGLRIGWMAPGRFFKKIQMLQTSTTMGASSLAQAVLGQYLSSKDHRKHLTKVSLSCSLQVNQTAHDILEHFPDGTKVSHPKGGFVLWLELPKKTNSVELYRKAMQKNISIAPGTLFSAKNMYLNYCRLSCSHGNPAKIEEAIKTLGRLAKEMI